ncbi:MAG: histidinol-phosphate transaminase [Chloroflexales bacterium]|nr:histidinol-phosphate transaminase [Chloroflexales bacterium]
MRFKQQILDLPAYKPRALTRQQPAGVTKLSSNENALGASPRALAAMQAALTNVYRYPDSGAAALKEALAQHAELRPEMVMCSNGSDELVLLLCLAFLEPGDEVVMAQGTFISYLMRTRALGATAVQVPLRDYTHDLDALANAITPRTRLLFVCNPNNPTGTVSTRAEVERLLRRVPDDVLVVMDEAYIEFATSPDHPDLLPELRDGRRNLLLLRTFAKVYGLAGLRLGYAYAHPDVVAYVERVRPAFNVNALAQAAGVAALGDHEHLKRSLEHAARSRAFYERELRALGLHPAPSHTNFIAVPVGDDAAVVAALAERGFTVMALSGWGVPGCIRISFGTDDENARFIAALREGIRG